ncbi:ATP-binding protein [Paenibacillus lutrae]|uniref:Circadian input-output histidine kinase CikA n=1 Tax=Paenibacillus lutrae TaxID=2078573 RepID=A0A7X3JY60_9BACL|nr:ATP-binding protein [Paenibacillus lutrae]MVO98716.1 response regulator [Paenibacillus lutrae]
MEYFSSYFLSFFANISTILAFTYIASLAYKFILYKLPVVWMRRLYIVLSIAAGWLSMMYGTQYSQSVIFDLRFVPIIVAPLFLTRASHIITIGAGIGIVRLTFGLNHAAWAGFANALILGFVTALCARVLARYRLHPLVYFGIIILIVNVVNVVDIAFLGVYPAVKYLVEMAPFSAPASLLFSFFFAFILHDFKTDFLRRQELNSTNQKLAEQFRVSQEKAEELQRIRLQLEEKNHELILASRYKSEFLANMSHELRTPLNSMLILSQFLAENPNDTLSEEEIEFAGIIHTSGQDLLNLINDILDLSKIEAGRMSISLGEVSVREVSESMNRMFEAVAVQKNLSFTIDSSGFPDIIHTDEQRLQQILKNLLSNAFKFTVRGGVTLEFLVETDDNGQQHPVVRVRDTGIGIRPDKLEQIFEAFYQADGTTSRKFGGTGLGLSISREFAILLGGDIRLASQEGTGSTFTLLLPSSSLSGGDQELRLLAEEAKVPRPMTFSPVQHEELDTSANPAGADPGAAGADPKPLPSPGTAAHTDAEETDAAAPQPVTRDLLQGVTVLVVDDDPNNVRSLSAVLESRGALIIQAYSGRECLKLLGQRSDIDIILMDIMMPEMNGKSAIRQIRRMDAFKTLPIIALTAKAQATERQECLRAGASDYMSKPIDSDALIQMLRDWTHERT